MNRADQAPEPSMEELLASIRLIISDADRKGVPQKEAAFTQVPPAAAKAAEYAASPGDEVFDLTDELVFPEEVAAPLAPPPARNTQPQQPTGPAGYNPPGFPADANPALPPPAASGTAVPKRAETAPGRQPPMPPVWSRRELPAGAGSPKPRQAQDAISARPQARNWPGDVQMPVPDQGPVSFIPASGTRPALHEPALEPPPSKGDEASGVRVPASAAGSGDKDEAAAVAALAENLARSAVGALAAGELKSAQKFDFEQLDSERKAEVAAKFADAIERESAARGSSPLPDMLDEVFKQDFIREPEPEGSMLDESAAFQTDDEARTGKALSEAAPSGEMDLKKAEAAKPEPPREAVQPVRFQTGRGAPGAVEEVPPKPSAPAAAIPAQPLAQAQFIGPAQPAVPAPAGRTLEDAVREMLRPLLVQWLNENMPRILEKAIREEIEMRGILPKSDS